MAFSETTKDAAYVRSGGRCECRRQDGLHHGHCPTRVPRRGYGVEFHHLTATSQGGSDGLSNCRGALRAVPSENRLVRAALDRNPFATAGTSGGGHSKSATSVSPSQPAQRERFT